MAMSSHSFPWVDGHHVILWAGKPVGATVTIKEDDIHIFFGDGKLSFKVLATTGLFYHVDKRGLDITKAEFYNVQIEIEGKSQEQDSLDCAVISKDGKKWTFMNGNEWQWMDEESFQQLLSETDLVENMPNDYKPRPMGKLVWISGGSGMGKTTTCIHLRASAGFVHYEGDGFLFGSNPYPGAAPKGFTFLGTRYLSGISDNRKTVCQQAAEGYNKIMKGEETQFSTWEGFYSLMCDEIIREREKLGGDWVISQAVYTREARDLIRERLGPGLRFVLLDMDPELQAIRCAKRRGSNSENTSAEAFEQAKKDCLKRTKGYERKQLDEKNTIQIEILADTKTEEIASNIIDFIST